MVQHSHWATAESALVDELKPQIARVMDLVVGPGSEIEAVQETARVHCTGYEPKNLDDRQALELVVVGAANRSAPYSAEEVAREKFEQQAADPVERLETKAVRGDQRPAEDLASATAEQRERESQYLSVTNTCIEGI